MILVLAITCDPNMPHFKRVKISLSLYYISIGKLLRHNVLMNLQQVAWSYATFTRPRAGTGLLRSSWTL